MNLRSDDGLSGLSAAIICESQGLTGLEFIDGEWWALDESDGECYQLTQQLFNDLSDMGEL